MEFRSLSQREARVILSLEAEGKELLSIADLQTRASVRPGFARKIAHDLVRKGWLQRLRRGTYLLNPGGHGPEALPDTDPFRVGSLLVEPYYFGFATAAELHGLLPQASRVYYLVSTARGATGSDLLARYRFVRTRASRFFGRTRLKRRGITLFVSDVERTLIDCVNRPDFSGGMGGVAQMLALAKPRLNWKRLESHVHRFGNRSLIHRMGYLLDRIRPSVKPPEFWSRTASVPADAPYAPLGSPAKYGRRGTRDSRWHVIENVPAAELFAEGEFA